MLVEHFCYLTAAGITPRQILVWGYMKSLPPTDPDRLKYEQGVQGVELDDCDGSFEEFTDHTEEEVVVVQHDEFRTDENRLLKEVGNLELATIMLANLYRNYLDDVNNTDTGEEWLEKTLVDPFDFEGVRGIWYET